MKIIKAPSPESGSTLLVVVMFVGIMTVALGSYLAMTSNENQATLRSRCWNAAMPLAEAGVEEAFSQLQMNAGNLTADGWNLVATDTYSKRRDLGNDHYIVTIAGTPTAGLTVSSTGFVQNVSIGNHGNYNKFDTGYIQRGVQVGAKLSEYPIPVGLVAKTSITFGGNLSVDSYDTSSLAGSSTNISAVGMYDATKRSAQAFVGSVSSAPMSLGGNEHVYGNAASGVGALPPSANGSASIGDLSWPKGAQAGHVTNNFTVILPDVVAPYSSASPPQTVKANIHGNYCDYLLNGGNYMLSSIAGKNLYVTNNSILYVTGDAAANQIVYANGAKLDLYVGGRSVPVIRVYNELTNTDGTFTLSQAVAPLQTRVLCMNSCTNLTMTGGANFVGIMYAPHVNFNSSGNATIFGSAAVDMFSCNGTFNLHYDRSLTNSVSKTTLRILSWAEK